MTNFTSRSARSSFPAELGCPTAELVRIGHPTAISMHLLGRPRHDPVHRPLNVPSEETTITTAYDRLFVEIPGTDGSVRATLSLLTRFRVDDVSVR
jgi:hypothetical protein